MNPRILAGEAIGTCLLLATVVGSGIMAQSLTQDMAVALLANTLATAGMLAALILTFADVSGAHFNPLVTVMAALAGERRWRDVPGVVVAQVAGALGGVALAHVMFGRAVVEVSSHDRGSTGECGARRWQPLRFSSSSAGAPERAPRRFRGRSQAPSQPGIGSRARRRSPIPL
jgi:glycerol uptake facilitator-like aquaporin